MVRLFVVLGFALLAGGAYAIVDGWPYRVLERGFTEVILGGLATVAGLILLALAAVLAEVRRLKGLVSGAMAAVALSGARTDEPQLPTVERVPPQPTPEKEPAPEHVGTTTALAAGAGAAAMAGALTGLATPGDKPDETAVGKVDEAGKAQEGARPDGADTIAAEPSQAPSAAAETIDDWLLPPVLPVLDVAPSLDAAPADARSGERDEPDENTETREEDEGRPVPAGADEAPLQDDDTKDDDAKAPAVPADEPAAEPPEGEGEAMKPDAAPASASEDRLWWPQIDRPAREQASSVDDEFSALRDQLAGVVNAPEVEPPRRDRDVPGIAESWTTARPWPPVTQPRDPGALADAEAEAADRPLPENAKAEAAPVEIEPAAPEPNSETESKSEPEPREESGASAEVQPAEEAGSSTAEAGRDEEPAASEEGVIGAYQVGETQFTMFADGSIHARTPDGDYTFASMDELKAYLASEKDKLESSSN